MSFLKAMQYGQVIENPGAYKSTQNTINFLVAVMGIGVSVLHSYGFAVNLSEEHVVTIATALAVFYSAFNVVFTMVTSDKSGIKISASQPSPSQVMAEQLPRLIAARRRCLSSLLLLLRFLRLPSLRWLPVNRQRPKQIKPRRCSHDRPGGPYRPVRKFPLHENPESKMDKRGIYRIGPE